MIIRHYKNTSIQSMVGEIWKPIPKYEGVYDVSNMGRIKRLIGYRCLTERILKQSSFGIGYLRVTLSKKDIKECKPVHVLVALAFKGNPNKYPIVLHDDDDPKNNCDWNLKWGTQKQNIQECHKKGRASNNLPKLYGANHPMYGKRMPLSVKKKMSDNKKRITNLQIDIAREMYKSGESLRESARKNGISSSYLSQLINGGYKRL